MSKSKTLLLASLVAVLAGTVMQACGTSKSSDPGGSGSGGATAGSSGGATGAGGDGGSAGAPPLTSHKVTIVGSGT